jgi:hypothetical protein
MPHWHAALFKRIDRRCRSAAPQLAPLLRTDYWMQGGGITLDTSAGALAAASAADETSVAVVPHSSAVRLYEVFTVLVAGEVRLGSVRHRRACVERA